MHVLFSAELKSFFTTVLLMPDLGEKISPWWWIYVSTSWSDKQMCAVQLFQLLKESQCLFLFCKWLNIIHEKRNRIWNKITASHTVLRYWIWNICTSLETSTSKFRERTYKEKIFILWFYALLFSVLIRGRSYINYNVYSTRSSRIYQSL